jgi:hypothetical protein
MPSTRAVKSINTRWKTIVAGPVLAVYCYPLIPGSLTWSAALGLSGHHQLAAHGFEFAAVPTATLADLAARDDRTSQRG